MVLPASLSGELIRRQCDRSADRSGVQLRLHGRGVLELGVQFHGIFRFPRQQCCVHAASGRARPSERHEDYGTSLALRVLRRCADQQSELGRGSAPDRVPIHGECDQNSAGAGEQFRRAGESRFRIGGDGLVRLRRSKYGRRHHRFSQRFCFRLYHQLDWILALPSGAQCDPVETVSLPHLDQDCELPGLWPH